MGGWLLCALLSAGCGSVNGEPVKYCRDIGAAETNIIKIKPGKTVILELVENPTTGYQWQFSNSATGVCRVTEDKFIPPSGKLAGAPGKRQLHVEAIAPGTAVLYCKYVRPWEKEQKPADKCTYTFEVENP